MRFLLKYPSRSRPALFRQRVAEWQSMASGEHEIRWVATFDADDETMTTSAMLQFCQEHDVTANYGVHHNKIEAINADVPAEGWDVLVLLSDDMRCVAQGWDKVIAYNLPTGERPNRFDNALWLPTGDQLRLCTMSIMGYPVWRELGHIYDPRFISTYCDDYFHNLMSRSNRLRYVDKQIAVHEHRKGNDDALMARNEDKAAAAKDRDTWIRLTTPGAT